MGSGRSSRQRIIAGVVVAVVVLGILFGVSDLRELGERARRISGSWTAAAAALGLLACLFMAATQRSLLAALGHRVAPVFMIRASFLSLAVSRIIRSGGVSGVVVIAWLLRLHGVPPQDAAIMKVGEFFLTNTVFALLFVAGALLLAAPAGAGQESLSGGVPLLAAGAAAVLLLLVLLWRVFVLERRRRIWAARAVRIAGAAGRLFRRDQWGERSRESIERVSRGGQDLLSSPSRIAGAQGWAVLRVAGSLGTTWACVQAVDVDVGLPGVILAWSLSKLAAVTVLVPAGLGIIEASLAGVLVALGATYEAALLAALLNRVTYHLVPTAAALVMAGRLRMETRAAAAGGAPEA